MLFQLWHLETAALIHTYDTEGAALAFVRDVAVFAGRDAGAQFRLTCVSGQTITVAEGEALVRCALEDRVL